MSWESLGCAPRRRQGLEDPQARKWPDEAEAGERMGIATRSDRAVMDFGRPIRRRRADAVDGRPRARGTNAEIIVEARNSVAALVAGSRPAFVLGDIDAVPGAFGCERARLPAILNRASTAKVEAIGWGHDGPAIRALTEGAQRPALRSVPGGAGMGHRVHGAKPLPAAPNRTRDLAHLILRRLHDFPLSPRSGGEARVGSWRRSTRQSDSIPPY